MPMRFQPLAAEGACATVNPFGCTRTVMGTPGSTAPVTAPVLDFPPSITIVPFLATRPDQRIVPEDGMVGCAGLAGAASSGCFGMSILISCTLAACERNK